MSDIGNELKKIMFVDLTFRSKGCLEKLFWVALGTVGGIWLLYFMMVVIEDKNPLIMMEKSLKVSDIKYPAITLCTDFSTRYAIAERLGNHLDTNKDLNKGFAKIRD